MATLQYIPCAKDIMTRHVESLDAHANVADGVHLMLQKHYSGIPVTDGGKVVGIFEELDCIRVLGDAAAHGWPAGILSSEMSKEIDAVDPEMDVIELVSRFVKGKHRRVLVMKDGQLLGLIARHDLVKALEHLGENQPRPSTYDLIQQNRN